MIEQLARMLGLSRTEAEESLHSERAARHVLTRRDAFGLAGAMCAGLVVGEVPAEPFPYLFRAGDWANYAGIEAWIPIVDADTIVFFGIDRVFVSGTGRQQTVTVSRVVDRESEVIWVSAVEADG